MRKYVEPHRQQWDSLTRRVGRDDAMLEWRVAGILEQIRKGGDLALRQVSEAIEGFPLGDFKGKERRIAMAYTKMRLQIFIDGELVNENMPVGWLKDPTGAPVGPDKAFLSGLNSLIFLYLGIATASNPSLPSR